MSDTPSAAPSWRPRWTAIITWAAMLIALLVTSYYALNPFALGRIGSFIGFNPGLEQMDEDYYDTVSVVALVLTLGVAVLILRGWQLFSRVTHQLMLSNSFWEDDAGEVPGDWVAPAGEDDNPARSLPAELMLTLGVAWAVMIVTPAVLSALQVFY